MGALTDLWKSERGLIAALLLVGATVLAAVGVMTFAEWREYTLFIYGTYAVTKTVTGSVALWRNGTPPPAPAGTSTLEVTATATPAAGGS